MSQISSTQNSKGNLYSLVLCAILIALSFVLGMVKIIPMPYGGSITLFSMLAATLTGYFCGPKWGLTSGVALGLLNLIIDPVILFPMQVLLDYVLAFGCLGLSGFFSNKKNGLYIGYIVAIIGRFICSFLSGFLFFGEYAPEGMNPEAGGHLQGVQRLQPSDSLPGGFPGVGSHTEQVQGRLPV